MKDFIHEENERDLILYEMFCIDPDDPDAEKKLEYAIECYRD